MKNAVTKPFLAMVLLYAAASVIHFIHNAEFLAFYPGLPRGWTRAGVYFGWLGMTVIGCFGMFFLYRGVAIAGFLLLAIYAMLGMDSLAHYFVAPFTHHTASMNVTILFEVSAGAVLFIDAIRRAIVSFHRPGVR